MIYIRGVTQRGVSGYMEKEIKAFIAYLHNVKNTSANTEMSYKRDLEKVQHFMANRGVHETAAISEPDLEDYVKYLEDNKFAAATVSRNIASLKAFYHYMVRGGHCWGGSFRTVESPED